MQSKRLVSTAIGAALSVCLSGFALAADAPSGAATGSGAAGTNQPAPNGGNRGATSDAGGGYGPGMMGGYGNGPGMMQGYGPGMRGGDGAGPHDGWGPDNGYGPGWMMRGYGPADDGQGRRGDDNAGPRGGWGPGGGYGPGWMMRGYSYGPGMMGGDGYGPGMMGSYGPWIMGPWMMGPGMMAGCAPWMAPGFAGDSGPYHGAYHQAALNLSVQDVQARFQRWLQWRHNPHLKLGPVKEAGADTITADIVTQDNSLVQRFDVDRHTGRISPADE